MWYRKGNEMHCGSSEQNLLSTGLRRLIASSYVGATGTRLLTVT